MVWMYSNSSATSPSFYLIAHRASTDVAAAFFTFLCFALFLSTLSASEDTPKRHRFDILFALNRQLHPGEKRQVEFALNHCHLLPANMQADLASILLLNGADVLDLPARVARLLDHFDRLLEQEGFDLKPGF